MEYRMIIFNIKLNKGCNITTKLVVVTEDHLLITNFKYFLEKKKYFYGKLLVFQLLRRFVLSSCAFTI